MKITTLKKGANRKVAEMFPGYRYHLTDRIIYTSDKKMLFTLVIEGMPFESVPDGQLESAFHGVKDFLTGIGKEGDIYLWAQLVKEKISLNDEYHFNNRFLNDFSEKYLLLFTQADFYKTTWYLTFGIPWKDVDEGIEKLNEIADQSLAIFKSFGATVLSVNSNFVSDTAGYLAFILNKNHSLIPASATPISESISDSELYFGYDTLELRGNESETKNFAVNYIIKDFPLYTAPGHWDFLLKLPYEFIITQSFIFEAPAKTLRVIDGQLNKLGSSGDAALAQHEELELGKEVVTSGITLFGSYHCVMTVWGDTPENARKAGIKVSSEFVTSGKGFRFIRAASPAPFAFFSHMPLSKKRPLDTRRTVTNLACTFSLHNYSFGKKSGNPPGDGSAIMPMKTVSDGLYYFNTHYTEPHRDMRGKKVAGHAMILGATGTGKTTFEGTAAGFLQRFDPCMFVVDYNQSTHLFVRAYEGQYFTLEQGVYTGLNPWQLTDETDSAHTQELAAFLKEWVKVLACDNQGVPPDDAELAELSYAVDAILHIPKNMRRTSVLLEYVTPGSDLAVKLAKWCDDGAYAWATDSPENRFNPFELKKVGFDTTVILEKVNGEIHTACQPILSVLFFYKNLMQKAGKLMLSIIEEFWMPANFPLTQAMIMGSLKAGRLKGEMMWLTSQSPEDAINCAIFAALVQQTPTKVFLPNPDADWEGYKKIGLTEKEFSRLKKLGKESRTMLIKQSGESAFAKMDLYGFDDFLPVISGTTEGIQICKQIWQEMGDDPDIWIPEFRKRLKEEY